MLVTPNGQTVRAALSSSRSALTVERWTDAGFQTMGNPFTDPGRSLGLPAIAADSSGNPTVAWVDGDGSLTSNVQVAHWDGANWVTLSAPQGVLGAYVYGGAGRKVSIAMTPSGQPVVAWASTSFVTLVAKFVSGTNWTVLGTAPTTIFGAGEGNGPIVRTNGAGDIFLASMTTRIQGALYHVGVSQFVGASWQSLGGALIQGGSARDYAMTVGPNGLPIVADSEYLSPANQLFTYRWTGASWQMPAPVGTVGDYLDMPALAVDPNGRLVAAWIDRTTAGAHSVAVARLEP
jgi:hypothetical protein